MKEFSVAMALVDYIPVLLFGLAVLLLQHDFYDRMNKISFALFAAGTIDVFCSGALKATYKLLYGAGICDFTALNSMFFPVQSIGFLLAGLGVLMLLLMPKKKKQAAALAVAPPVFSGTFLFVGIMVSGLAMMCFGLWFLSCKMKKYGALICFITCFVCSLCMGYLSSQDFDKAIFNWIGEIINIIGQAGLLVGAIILHRAGLRTFDWKVKTVEEAE